MLSRENGDLMSDSRPPFGPPDFEPAPGAIHELAERTVDFVRHAIQGKRGGIVLDYRPDTLPVLDHYLRGVPRDQPATVALIGAAAGAYFGEVVRRALGGEWEQTSDPPEGWTLVLPGDLRIVPGALADSAIRREEDEACYDVPEEDRAAVEDALDGREVPEDEYYSLAGRLEVLQLIIDVVVGRAGALRSRGQPEDDSTGGG
jgi:hypothetical protein